MGSSYFSDLELKSSDYSYFLFSEDLLTGLVLSEIAYGYPLQVHQYNDDYRAYLSPNRLYKTKPPEGQPTYWEDNPESPHIYGSAADIQVVDRNLNGSYQDDWDTLAAIMLSHGINPIDMGDTTYIHAEDSSAFLSSLVTIVVNPDTVEPGTGADYVSRPNIVRQCSVHVAIDASLSPYSGNVQLRVEEVLFSGGHHHSGRPLNPYPVVHDVSSDSLNAWHGLINTVYRDTCKFGGQYRFIAYYQDGSRLYYSEDTLTIGVRGLIEYIPDTTYIWTGRDTVYHPPHNHFIFTGWKSRADGIIRSFYDQCDSLYPEIPGEVIRLNDISLINGGLFDVGRAWRPDPVLGHVGHRGGFEADISFTDFSTTHPYYQILIQVCKRISGEEPWVWAIPYKQRYSSHIHARFCTKDERNWPVPP